MARGTGLLTIAPNLLLPRLQLGVFDYHEADLWLENAETGARFSLGQGISPCWYLEP